MVTLTPAKIAWRHKKVSEQKNTIILNGKVYDAKSGDLLVGGHSATSETKKAPSKTTESSDTTNKTTHHQVINHARHKPQHAKTLMRSAVKKPSPQRHNQDQVIAPPVLRPTIPAERLARAKAVSKSKLISRFHTFAGVDPPATKSSNPLPHTHAREPISHHHTAPINPAASIVESTEDFLASALSQATSHEQTLPKHSKTRHKKLGISSRIVNVSAAVLVVVVLSGFIAYQNLPNISMRLAAQKAGIAASLPRFSPSGFSLNRSIATQPGRILLSFHSNSDSRNFHISQTASDWNSQTLASNYLVEQGQHYEQVNQPNGQIIFLYGNANATWVNGGIWYRIEGNSSLTSSQLLKVASSF